ncbi:MAG: tRNA (adenosine(37)-N6)-threonylcarbamoyltransferase complex ATPase subunit type 1 TsaE [Xanthobacteraceae bacterium]|uniref:tRNA (adenosine(37)-N6)-threonylcarbamoyltransferase complex ATPase subunit type 1 TsaE n=1 Tax=Pseudolabrys sp. TaxID=1960880 RepID=UPI003D10122E
MTSTSTAAASFTVALADERATHRLAVDVAAMLAPGDTITLSGDLGAGKTTFARALIRRLASDRALEVPSPTFTLIQTYDLPRFPVAHIDLFRVSDSAELAEIGIDDLTDKTVTLIEWPERAASLLPENRFDIALSLSPQQGSRHRNATLTGYGTCAPRAERIAAMRAFIERCGLADAERKHMQGDASTRAYERFVHGGHSYVLMNAPRRPDGPPVRDGKPYSTIAHLAEDVTPFVAMANALRSRGFSAPAVLAADRAAGFLLIEDLGHEGVVAGTPPAPIEERYAAAADLLAALHAMQLPATIPVEAGVDYTLPPYDIEALLIEAELLTDWYLPMLGAPMSVTRKRDYLALWREALTPALQGPPTWVMRDYHSPNLLWLPDRKDRARVGLLDFQDAVMGSPAYDLASLLQDARVDVSEMTEITLLSRYTRARLTANAGFDAPGFAQCYAALAAQRASKILGIFARLDRRDGKPQYLRHIPRVWGYLQRSLEHPALAPLKAWYATNVPALKPL